MFPDATQMATNSFLDFSDDAIRAVDNDRHKRLIPLFEVSGRHSRRDCQL